MFGLENLNFHFHAKFSKWEDLEAVETLFGTGGAIIQTRICLDCGTRQLRKTNSVSSSDNGDVCNILEHFLNKKKKSS